MLFHDLVKSQLEPSLVPEITELLKMKENSSEMGLVPKRQRLNDIFLESLDMKGRIKDFEWVKWSFHRCLLSAFGGQLKTT